MKKIFLTVVMTSLILTSFSQDTTKRDKVHRNEFGIDATGFIKQLLNFNQNEYYYYYYPNYYLTYRRHFKCGNIRFALGGDFSDHDIPAAFTGDSNKYHYTSYSYDCRIGWEFFNELSKRWQVFYGLDFRPSKSYTKNDVPYWNGGYANGTETKSQIYGIAPLLGFRFKLSNRLSIMTETSFSVNIQKEYSRKYYIPVTNMYPPIPDDITPKSIKYYSNFMQPLSLFITFNI
jgi:hypothetical protein